MEDSALQASYSSRDEAIRLGIGSWTYGWAVGVRGYPCPARPLTSMDLLRRAQRFGLDIVQLADNLCIHELPRRELVRLRDYAHASGITIELGMVGIEAELLLSYLDLALFFGTRLIRTLPRTPPGKACLAIEEKSIRLVIDRYRAAGVVLALENYEQHSSAQLGELVKRIGDPFVGICLDTVNSFGALETPKQVVETLGPYVRNLHIKDFTVHRVQSKMGYEIVGCPAGQGKLEIGWILEELRKHGAKPTVILEQWTPWVGSIEETVATEERWAEQSLEFLGRYR